MNYKRHIFSTRVSWDTVSRVIILGPVCLLFIFFSCNKNKDDSIYFVKIDKELSNAKTPDQIKKINQRELQKYKKSNDQKFLISSKYAETFLYQDDDLKNIAIIYELLKLNDGHYKYVTVAGNYFLGLKIENSSPKLAIDFFDDAIKIEEKTKTDYFLPHVYHAKGSVYHERGSFSNAYNKNFKDSKKDFDSARKYFIKALNTFKKTDTLHIASMYNNLGMCDEGTQDYERGISNIQYAINFLGQQKRLNDEELHFLYVMKGNLGVLYFDKKNYPLAEKYFIEKFNFDVQSKDRTGRIVGSLRDLLDVYKITNAKEKENEIMNFLLLIKEDVKGIKTKIIVNRILQKYYSEKNDLEKMKLYSSRLNALDQDYNKEISTKIDYISDVLNGYIIKNINEKYNFKVKDEKRKNIFLSIITLLVASAFVNIIFKIKKRNLREKIKLQYQNAILENSRTNLEHDIEQQKDKIKDLHMNLNLKIEAEKAFLENLKKVKKNNNANSHETIKDLLFKVSSLLFIDDKNYKPTNEITTENEQFIEYLSEKYPSLSESELKLCIYFRMSLNSKEISLLENITPGSVRVYKTKIKTKIGLEKDQDLNSFLNTIK
ncbi:hypothetical protein SAMN05880574_12134 [Chryseobacterium sp. RU37D]|uniref:hypothetical protein n=1 Tax=Chryseobacterium sp. RU37D TaxID=1907397 RepID=UPI0009572D85|nr:hypothetical protein [Chryseobacterium sp. RU37D]SIQ69515.1 hypothetical protein SAMN05880574_12134 [Chryseobacterium sp. RU37D]